MLKDGNRKFLQSFFKDSELIFIDRSLKLPVKIRYKTGLGNDRICNAVAASQIYDKMNMLIIDYGTATTYTVLENNIVTGGMISPGVRTSLLSLTARTSLPEVSLNFPSKLFSDNTAGNIRSGVMYQSLFASERVIIELRKKHKDLFVIATGGYSGKMGKRSGLIDKIDKELVLKGINLIISYQFSISNLKLRKFK